MSHRNFITRNNIGMVFPYKESEKGQLFELTNSTTEAIKSQLRHLLLTKKNTRYYRPEFGIDLIRYVYEPLDDATSNNIKQEIISTVLNRLYGVKVKDIDIQRDDSGCMMRIKVSFEVSDGIISEDDFVELTF